jgi:hypothetical protein
VNVGNLKRPSRCGVAGGGPPGASIPLEIASVANEGGSGHLGASPGAAVGEWYLANRSAANDVRVIAAYEQLQMETDRLFGVLFLTDDPHSVRVAFTGCRQPYGCDQDLIAAVRAYGILEITTAAVASERLHPLLDCGFGGAFDRFRAIHDFIGHVITGFGFDLAGEVSAWHVQDGLHSPLARSALATEICGVNCARWIAGESPDLKAMLFEPEIGTA